MKKKAFIFFITEITNSNVFFGTPYTSDSPKEPYNFMYGLAEVDEALNFLLGTISTE